VCQIGQRLERILNDVVGRASGNIRDKSDSARIVLVEWIVQQLVASKVSHLSPARIRASVAA
jgi:hypothetical protein